MDNITSAKKFCNHFILEKDLQMLKGMILGIESDSIINNQELAAINHWIQETRDYGNKPVYTTLINYLREAIADNFLSQEERKEIVDMCDCYTTQNQYFDAVTSGIQQLHGVMKGISSDGVINQQEVDFLNDWLEENDFLQKTWPYDEAYSLVTQILQDGKVDDQEQQQLLEFCNAITSGDNPTAKNNKDLIALLRTNFYHIDPVINIEGARFVITGASTRYKRSEIADMIKAKGGIHIDRMNNGIDYLIICANKNECWAFSSYGRKIESAINLRKEGKQIVIAHENDLYDVLHR